MSSKAKNLVIRAWLEQGGVNAWRATVTNLDTKQARGFSRISELVKHLESELAPARQRIGQVNPQEQP